MNNDRLNFRYVIENEVFDVLAMDLSIGSVSLDLKGKYNEREAGEPLKPPYAGLRDIRPEPPQAADLKRSFPSAMHYRLIRLNTDNLLACTGIKDKNGKLIYEGDIVKVSRGSSFASQGNESHLGAVNTDARSATPASHVGIVKWCDYILRFFLENDDMRRGLYPDDDNEILGNIYENPELCEAGANELLRSNSCLREGVNV